MPDLPLVDPETGEVLAVDQADLLEVRQLLAGELVTTLAKLREGQERAEDLRRRLALVLEVGDAVAVGNGWAVTVKPGAPARRAVNKQALQEHAESLEPLGLAPVEKVELAFPGVAALTSTKARAALARLGLTPEAFLLAGEAGEPRVEVVAPDA